MKTNQKRADIARLVLLLLIVLASGLGPVLVAEPLPVERSARAEGRGPSAGALFDRIEYDREAGDLLLTFADGSTYRYRGVPQQVYLDLTRIVNQGEYFADRIRNRYAFARLPAGEGPMLAGR